MTPTEPGPGRGVDAAGPSAGPSSAPPESNGAPDPVIASSDVPAMGEE